MEILYKSDFANDSVWYSLVDVALGYEATSEEIENVDSIDVKVLGESE